MAEVASSNGSAKVLHPLEPLHPAEISAVKAIVVAAAAAATSSSNPELGEWNPDQGRFESIELKEPPKAAVRCFRPGDAIPRHARVNVYQLGCIGVWRLVVSIDEERVVSCTHLPQACPMIQLEEFTEIEETVLSCPEFIAACAKRGIHDMTLVCVDPWSGGTWGKEAIGRVAAQELSRNIMERWVCAMVQVARMSRGGT